MAFVYNTDGELKRRIKMMRINDLALTRDGTVMVTVNQEKLIKVQRLSDSKDVRGPFLTLHVPSLSSWSHGINSLRISVQDSHSIECSLLL
jgi:hypothetical protein